MAAIPKKERSNFGNEVAPFHAEDSPYLSRAKEAVDRMEKQFDRD